MAALDEIVKIVENMEAYVTRVSLLTIFTGLKRNICQALNIPVPPSACTSNKQVTVPIREPRLLLLPPFPANERNDTEKQIGALPRLIYSRQFVPGLIKHVHPRPLGTGTEKPATETAGQMAQMQRVKTPSTDRIPTALILPRNRRCHPRR